MATPNPIQPIQPLNIPSAAGINYGEGDVRHFAQGDAMSVPGVSNPTRQLAERDNLLAEKLNEVIQNVNNQEQFVPLPIVRTVVPPNDQTIVLNYRIPAGFESRILNATIGSSPSSPDVELDIYYNTTFGGATGTAVVTTTTEFTGGVNFYQSGEFIVTLKNKSGITLEMVASILLTLRPLGSEGTLLVGSVIRGDKGDPGQGGPPGPPGNPGSGGVGSPGMNWTGTWVNNHIYSQRDVARYDLGFETVGVGTIVSSFFCLQGHTSSDAIIPSEAIGPYWEPVALGGAPGTGAAGPAGPSGSYTVSAAPVQGRLFTSSSYVAGVYNATYTSLGNQPNPSSSYSLTANETSIFDMAATPKGFAIVQGQYRLCFAGSICVRLPDSVTGLANVDYTVGNVFAMVTANGTSPVDFVTENGSIVKTVEVSPFDGNSWSVIVNAPTPVPVTLQILGTQQIV